MKEIHNGNRGGATLMMFLTGAVAGATVALLTAPRPGRETRARLRRLARETGDRAGRVPRAVRDACSRASEAARESFSEALEKSA